MPDSARTHRGRIDPLGQPEAYFGPALFDFLGELAANNNRDWFLANRARYEADVRDPVLVFITDAGPALRAISPHIVADPRPVGGSMFRINRDTRFSRNKSPYRPAVEMSFGHSDVDKRTPAPRLFMRMAPGGVTVAGGLYRADGPALKRVRDAIVADPAGWARITGGAGFAPMFQDRGNALKNPPPGYPPDHPLVEDLKRRSYVCYVEFSEADACEAAFMDRFVACCTAAAPLSGFLAGALGLGW